MYYTLTYNDETAEDHNLYVKERPSVPAPERDRNETTIPGMDGVLIEDNGRYKPITISVTFYFVSDSADVWGEDYREAKAWLSATDAKLCFDDDEDVFYYAYYATVKTTERTVRRVGKLEVEFYCKPYCFLESGTQEYDYSKVLTNQYEGCRPIYKLTGVGTCTLAINGNEIEAYVSGTLIIDTERLIAYTDTGESSNTAISGDYDDMILVAGTNAIEVSDGFSLTVIPNWRQL